MTAGREERETAVPLGTDDLRAEKKKKKVGCIAQESVFLFPPFRKSLELDAAAVRAEAAGRDTFFFFFFC